MGEWTFRDELELEQINIPRAALQFARAVAYPDLDVAAYMMLLSEISEVAGESMDFGRSVFHQAGQLADVLFNQFDFSGNTENYFDPRNSFLNDVLERRLGIPITLSVLYVDIATRLGIPAYGIGLPGHFIVGVHGRNSEIWLDPFHRGRRLDLTDCAALIRMATKFEGPIEASWFTPATAQYTLSRMLANLRAIYVANATWHKAAAIIQLLRQVEPDEPEHLRDLGLVHYHQGHFLKAAYFLDTYLQLVPHAVDAQIIRDGMNQLLDGSVPMN
jgi:regulator of sirC expression with transglutaminase-like and TPR domain